MKKKCNIMIDHHRPDVKVPLWPRDSRIMHDVPDDTPLPGKIQTLISSEDYNNFDDHIIVESQFIELDKYGDPIRPVFVALSKKNVIIAIEEVPDLRQSRSSILVAGDEDCNSRDLELEWLAPIFLVNISMILEEEILNIKTAVGHKRYFLLSNIRGGGDRDINWIRWIMSIEEVNQDHHGYVRAMKEKYNIKFDEDGYSGTSSLSRGMAQSLAKINGRLVDKLVEGEERIPASGNSVQYNSNFYPAVLPLDLYDTSGILPQESKTNTGCFSCAWHSRKRHKKKHRKF